MDNEIKKALLKRIEERMKKCYLNKSEMAKRLDMDYSTFWRKMNGEYSVDAVLLKKIAEVLGTSVAYLMGETDNPVLGVSEEPEQLQLQKAEKPQDISYWGNFLTNIQKVANSGNLGEISSVESFINSAAGLLAMGRAQAMHGAMA